MATTGDAQVSPKIGFLDLPGELRNQIYTHLVVKAAPEALPLCIMKYDPAYLNLAILRTCKKVYSEASALFYTLNHFDASGCAAVRLDQFIDRIGPVHAEQVQHLAIDHPLPAHPCLPSTGYFTWRGPAEMESKDEEMLVKIGSNFANLVSLTTVPESIHYVFYDGTCQLAKKHDATYAPYMRLVDCKFRCEIPTLKTIRLRVPSREADLGASDKAMMEELKWEIEDRHADWCEQSQPVIQRVAVAAYRARYAHQDELGGQTNDMGVYAAFLSAMEHMNMANP